MNKDLQTEIDMVFDRAVMKSYNKMSYSQGLKHILKSYLFTKSNVYKGILSRRQAGIFRELQVSRARLRVRKDDVPKNPLYLKMHVKNYLRNMWFGWSVHWQDAQDKNPLVRLRYYIYHLV